MNNTVGQVPEVSVSHPAVTRFSNFSYRTFKDHW